MSKHENVLQALPRLWLELLAIVGLAILVISMLSNGKSTETLIPIIGLFAAAAFRMMPSVNRILVSIQGLRYNLPVISSLYKEAQLVNKTSDSTSVNCLSFKHEIHLKSVGYSYEGVDYDAISNINLIIPRGKSVGIIGESGAGKSTLVDVILGLLTPTKGTVEVDGIDVQFNLRGWQNHIGYVSQTIYLTDDTLRCNIAFGLEKKDINDKAIKAAINASQLQDFVDSLPDGLDTMVGERGVRISGGQRQRIGIARALYHNPSVLVLDEATSALDTVTEAAVMKSVYELQGNKTVIIIAHRLSAISMCDLFFELNKGNLIQKDKAPC